MNIVMNDRKCEICGALNTSIASFAYDAEYSDDDYYQTDSVKMCPYSQSSNVLIVIRKSILAIEQKNELAKGKSP